MKDSIIFVGLDVHKDTIDIALAESSGTKEVRRLGKRFTLPNIIQSSTRWASHEAFSPTYKLYQREAEVHQAPADY